MDNKKMQKELAELKKNPEKVRAMIALLEGLLDEEAETPKQVPERTTKYDPVEVEELIAYHLLQMGVPRNLMGYRYLKESIAMAVENPERINFITKALYPEVAKKFQTTPSRVERAIRHAVEVAWDRCDIEILQDYFGNTISNTKGKPTNSEFIAMFMDRIPREMR